jgi:DNA-binding transcriptional ArsR family regulator
MKPLDYDLDEAVLVSTPAQHKALGHPLRHTVLGVLNQRAATISQLADALGELKGTVSHHIRVLETAGLVRVVRTRKVRGATERYYGRSARRFEITSGQADGNAMLLGMAASEAAPADPPDGFLRYQRFQLDDVQAVELAGRLEAVVTAYAAELTGVERPGARVWALVAGLLPTSVPSLPEDASGG